jgi:hypothetical protein
VSRNYTNLASADSSLSDLLLFRDTRSMHACTCMVIDPDIPRYSYYKDLYVGGGKLIRDLTILGRQRDDDGHAKQTFSNKW